MREPKAQRITIDELLKLSPVIPVVVVEELSAAVPVARALLAGGIRVIEIVLRTREAIAAIGAIRELVPEMIVGAGTVLNPKDLEHAVAAGSQFIVTPGATPNLLKAATLCGRPVLPGIATASDVMVGLEHGYNAFKFFPAHSSGGVEQLKALQQVFAGSRFCPTGGIDVNNLADYLALDSVSCVGGSWVAPRELMRQGDWKAISALAAQAIAAVTK